QGANSPSENPLSCAASAPQDKSDFPASVGFCTALANQFITYSKYSVDPNTALHECGPSFSASRPAADLPTSQSRDCTNQTAPHCYPEENEDHPCMFFSADVRAKSLHMSLA